MRTGRPPKPTEQKRRLGNPGQRRLPAPIVALPAVVKAHDAAPGFADGRAMLQRLLDEGGHVWIGATDRAKTQRAVELWDDVALARRVWLSDPTEAVAGRMYRDLGKALDECLASLGLDPVSRSRLGVAEVKAASKLEELRARRDARSRAG